MLFFKVSLATFFLFFPSNFDYQVLSFKFIISGRIASTLKGKAKTKNLMYVLI